MSGNTRPNAEVLGAAFASIPLATETTRREPLPDMRQEAMATDRLLPGALRAAPPPLPDGLPEEAWDFIGSCRPQAEADRTEVKVGSLFSGAGLGDYGLELAGMEIAFQVEIDPYCQKVLQLRWPDVPKWTDIRDVNPDDLPAVDVLAGGFPCQDLSTAGKQEGIDGKRSGLWSEYARLIRAVRPRFVIVENVPGLLVRGMGRVLGDLAASGYDAEWQSISAASVGAPHLRDRIWIVADAIDPGSCEGRAEGDGADGNPRHEDVRPAASERRADVADAESVDEGRYAEWWTPGVGWWEWEPQEALHDARERGGEEDGLSELEPVLGRVADGVPFRVDRLKALGNGQVVQVAAFVGRHVMTLNKKMFDSAHTEEVA